MVFKTIKVQVLAFILCASVFGQAYGAEAANARQLVENFQSQLIEVMKNGKALKYAGRYEKLFPAVSNSHDLTKIARIVVGKEWEKLSEAQQQKLVDVFSRFSVASYAHNFKDFSGEAFTVDSEEQTTRGGVIIHGHLGIPGEKDVKFDYMLKEMGSSWRIINIIANGVSDLALKQSEYSNILQREGFDALIAKIEEKIESYSKQ
jgi:phospholipid transport system substrate-binding protein